MPIDTTLWLDLKTWATEHRIPDGQSIFTRKGHPLTNPVERRQWIKALQAAGLPYVTIRSARHFYATQLAAGGASEDARKAIMGHTKISVTAGYTHWRPEDLAALAGEARAAIGESAVV
ncbi:tyrosine-type recombinase/integrase [Bifidobacterium breve]|uniref:tyrosine-type recombinase/integrase n=1 Tax=Bifidobacterium breve TaxID=1685 RepID=UPI0013DDD665|nr:tyrosine-type recombinase/integrase [Bifidobacterium breve]